MKEIDFTNNEKNKYEKRLEISYYFLIIPVMMIFILPLIMWGYKFETSNVFNDISLSSDGYAFDVFLRGKQIWLYCVAGISLLIILYWIILKHKAIHFHKWMIFSGIYLLFSFISAINAEDVKTALFGGENMFQGFFVLLSYFILFYYAYILFSVKKELSEKLFILFSRCALFLSILLTIIGVFQFCNNNPFTWNWVQRLCNMTGVQIAKNSSIFLTLYNSNYVGVIVVLLLPLLVAGLVNEKKIWLKLGFGVAIAGMLGCLIASGSKTAMIIVVFITLVCTISSILRSRQSKKITIIILTLTFIVSLLFVFINNDSISKVNNSMPKWNTKLNGMATEKDYFKLKIKGKELRVSWDDNNITFTKENGNTCKIKAINDSRIRKLQNKLQNKFVMYYGESEFSPQRLVKRPYRKVIFFKSSMQHEGKAITGYVFFINKRSFFITNEVDDKYTYYNSLGKFVDMDYSEDIFLKRYYGIASNRVYIWSKTIPLLKNNIICGVGMEHFPLEFPNNDYASKARIGKLETIYNKPHSWYLQTGMESGVISLLCMFAILVYILKRRIKKPISFNNDNLTIYNMGFKLSIFAYCLVGIFYDQMIVTAPLFYVILGAYASMNKK